MTRISSTELRPRLAEALRTAEGGDPVVITRHGRPAAALIAADQLPRLERPAADDDTTGAGAAAGGDAGAGAGAESPDLSEEPTPEELLERAAAPSLRRIDVDLERLPEALKPVLEMIRRNLFEPRLTVGHIKRALGVGSNDLTTRFRDAAGAPIREYRDDRRQECAGRLLVDTELEVETVGLLVGYKGKEVFSRAFNRRYGVRPLIYRECRGRLSPEALSAARPGRAPAVPRYLAGLTALASGVPCAGCGHLLEPGVEMRVFDDLAPICDRCAREQAPELAVLLEAGRAGAEG